ncbi:MAG TPA: PRC-barrel domain-containing protein [Methylomirabilota bacterium]|jgi:sporulation protein YlmC with PRC-barrel domain
MKMVGLLILMSVVIAAGAADSVAQTAGSTVISVSKSEMRQVATGWSAKKQILGKDVYNDTGEKIGEINDLIVAPNKSLSYAIIGVGGFLGMGDHEVAVPVSKFKQQMGKIVLHGATKDALKAAPKFEYASK